MTRDVMVVGGGVIGCAMALRLAEAGLKVTVIERDRIGCEASRAAAGMLSPQAEATNTGPFFDLCLQSRLLYPDFAAHVAEMSGVNVEYRDEGSLFIALNEEDEIKANEWSRWQMDSGLAIERLGAEAIRRLEPAITRAATEGFYIPDDHQVENRKLMDAFDVAMRRAGVEVIEGKEVDSLTVERDKVTGVVAGGERLSAGMVVIAAGCWSGRLLEPAGLHVPVIPAHGQMIAVRGETAALEYVTHSHKCYLVPRLDGRILIGATVEYTGFQKGLTVTGLRSLLDAAIEAVPAIEQFEVVEAWSGLRPDTTDHLPVIGRSGIENLLLATGHFRNGILLAPITARLIADLVISGREAVELLPFSVERFAAAACA